MNRHADFSPQDPGNDPRIWRFPWRPTSPGSCGLTSACRVWFKAGEQVRMEQGASPERLFVEAGFQPASQGGILPRGWEAWLTGSQGWLPLQLTPAPAGEVAVSSSGPEPREVHARRIADRSARRNPAVSSLR